MSINLLPSILRNDRIIVEAGLNAVKETDDYIHIRIRKEIVLTEYEEEVNNAVDAVRVILFEFTNPFCTVISAGTGDVSYNMQAI